jgi:hypothetical protein
MDLDVNTLRIITIIIRILTVCLFFALLNIYRESYKKIKIGFTIGLMIFSLLLILKILSQIIISIFLISTNNPDISIVLRERDLLPAIIEFIAVFVLYHITKKY